MKILKASILLITILISQLSAIAQSQKTVTAVGNHIRFDIGRFFSEDKSLQTDSCINTVVIAKFKIIGGKIDSAVFSPKVPPQIKVALQKAINTFNNEKTQMKELKEFEGRFFLLPLILHYQSGCGPQIVSNTSNQQPTLDALLDQSGARLSDALANMLKFDNGNNYLALDCIILAPLIVGSMN